MQTQVMVVAAAGNDGAEACLTAPANVPLVLSVGADAVKRTGVGTAFAAFSNYGRCVDLWAPGTGVNASLVTGEGTKSGTSMAVGVGCGRGSDLGFRFRLRLASLGHSRDSSASRAT